MEAVGRESIVYYLSHYPVMVLVGAGLTSAGISNPWVHIMAALASALVVGWLLVRGRRSPVVAILFRLPGLGGRRRSAVNA